MRVLFSSEGERELRPEDLKKHPYAIELNSTMVTRIYFGKGGRHPILKQHIINWCMDKNNIKYSWYCEYVRVTPISGYSVIRFMDKLDATLFRLFF